MTSTRPAAAAVPAALAAALDERYVLERELGHGGMATVYRARDRKHDRIVAVKVLRPELASAVGSDRFLREIAIASQLQHPHILTLIDSGETRDPKSGATFLYYVMPFVEGESLRDRLARGGALPPSEARQLMLEVADALACAHGHGVVHRDIKPDNVMLTAGHALVVDFGVAKAMSGAREDGPLTATGMSIGTPAYMAPEQAAGDPGADHRADIYALGVLGYEMLAGRTPFTGTPQSVLAAQITMPPPPLDVVMPGTPPALARVVMRCLEKEPAARYPTSEALRADLQALATPSVGAMPAVAPARSRRAWLAGAAAVVAVAVLIVSLGVRDRRARWVHATAVPAIQALAERGRMDSAYALASRAEQSAPGDSVLARLWARISQRRTFRTEPAGATVWRAPLTDTTRWEQLGATPLDSVRIPLGAARFRIEKPGFRPVHLVTGAQSFISPALPPVLVLDAEGAPDADMVRIPGGEIPGGMPGLTRVPVVRLGDFRMDRDEVTNRQYKAFVDAGGYAKPEYWPETLEQAGRRLTRAEGLALMVDRTGRPGPATWEAGDIPRGQEDLPVAGVSWYEAMAYAKFAGKRLPTLYHWSRAASVSSAAFVVPGSNFGGQGARRASSAGMSAWGVNDLGGNVREWCLNADAEGKRYVLGGGWNDATYMFTDAYAQPPLDRSVTNGIRLARYADEPTLARASAPIVRIYRDLNAARPVPDPIYRTYLEHFEYDRTPLDVRVESRDTTSGIFVRERVSFAAAYGRERVLANVWLPKRGAPPYQAVVLFPGSNALFDRVSNDFYASTVLDFVVKSGRALVLPIYEGTYERGGSVPDDAPIETIAYRDHVVHWGKDLRRTLDYLGTRGDVDTTRLGYIGISWGGRMGGVMLAVEPRFRAAVLYVAGLRMDPQRPEVDPVNHLPRVRVPVLMLNGKHDHFFPTETAQKPFFNLLGTAAADKKYLLYEGGHFVPRDQFIAESLRWYDKYLGPVAR